jgi:hypothetical protein
MWADRSDTVEAGVTDTGAGNQGPRFKGSDILAFLDSRREGGPSPSPSVYRHIGKYLPPKS